MTLKTISDEFRSRYRQPEKLIVDAVVKQAGAWLFGTLILLYTVLAPYVRHHVPAVGAYLLTGRPWWGVTLGIVVVWVVYIQFTHHGRKRRLRYLLRKVHQYKRFNHEKEMESISRMHAQTRKAAILLLQIFLVSLPLILTIIYLFGTAIISDITNNIKGTHYQPPMGSKLFFNLYIWAIGAALSYCSNLLESARVEALMLSAQYRHRKLTLWQTAIEKLKSKLHKPTTRKVLAEQNVAASTLTDSQNPETRQESEERYASASK
ncbi:MAG: hypothetical protein JOY85_13225 [Acidobacteriaceae bacterium]|nr:hypothetical protein [Acidobacteriaceae bacterium]